MGRLALVVFMASPQLVHISTLARENIAKHSPKSVLAGTNDLNVANLEEFNEVLQVAHE